MSGLLGYFSFDAKKPAGEETGKQKPVRALPASWYTSPLMYDFERRAVFADRWLFMTSTLRVPAVGDYVRYQFAGYDVLVFRDGEKEIRAAHNQSRKTGRRLVEEGTDEAAGRFSTASLSTVSESEEVFDVHTHIDRNGFVWVNLDASPLSRSRSSSISRMSTSKRATPPSPSLTTRCTTSTPSKAATTGSSRRTTLTSAITAPPRTRISPPS